MKEKNYEACMQRLEEIVQLLENDKTPIEQSLELFKEGIDLTHYCQETLKHIEKEMIVITQGDGENENND